MIMKKIKLLLTLTFLTIVIMAGYISCRKSDIPSSTIQSTETKFFTSHRGADPVEKTIVDFLIKENNKNQFIEKTVNQIGFPVWDKIIKRSKTSSNIVKTSMSIENKPFGIASEPCDVFYIPFVRDSQNYVNASMVITATSTDTSISYLCDWQYKSKSHGSVNDITTAENYATFFMYLDRNTLGHNQFKITDTTLFSKTHTNTGSRVVGFANKSNSNGSQIKVFSAQICLDVYVCNWLNDCGDHCDYLSCSSDFNPCYLVQSYCSAYDPSATSTDGITVAFPGTTVGGSGGGGSTPPTPCGIDVPSKAAQNNVTTFNTPCSSTTGWVHVTADRINNFDGTETFFAAGPPSQIVDINKMMKCFGNISDIGATYKIQLCVAIADINNPATMWKPIKNVGHAFLTFTKTNGNQSISQSIGFYPATAVKSLSFGLTASTILNDGFSGEEHGYNASLTLQDLSKNDFNTVIGQAITLGTHDYDLNDFNCANFAVYSINSIRGSSPINSVSITKNVYVPPSSYAPVTYSQSPSGLYQALAMLKNSNSVDAANIEIGVTKFAQTSKGECN